MFINRADDEMDQPTRELAFGRHSRVPTSEGELETVLLNPDDFATNPHMKHNPHPSAQQLDQDFRDLGFTSATEFIQVEEDNIITIDLGSAFEQLSDDIVTPAFKQYMMLFRWRINLKDFRLRYQVWDKMNRRAREREAAAAVRRRNRDWDRELRGLGHHGAPQQVEPEGRVLRQRHTVQPEGRAVRQRRGGPRGL
jgi:hypothetical protein